MTLVLFGALGGVIAIFTSWLITGFLFHRFQAETPGTWRPEGPRQYAAASALDVFAGAAIGLLYWHTGGVHIGGGAGWLFRGALFGVLAWLALALPVILSMATFVYLHRGVVVGLLLDWLAVALLASIACAWAVRA
jgi:hypothetical protein